MPDITIPLKKNHRTYNKWATFLNLTSLDRKYLAECGPGFHVLQTTGVWSDEVNLRVNVEGKILRPNAEQVIKAKKTKKVKKEE